MKYIMLVATAVLLSADFTMNKIYQKTYGASLYVSLVFNILSGVLSSVIFIAFGGLRGGITIYSVIMAAISSLFVMSYNIIGFKILKLTGKMVMYTMYLMTGGMILPYIYGLVSGEPISFLRTAGLVLMIFGIAISNFTTGGTKINSKVFVMCTAVFLLNGGVSMVSKIHQTQGVYERVNESCFIVLSGITKAVLALIALCFVKKTEHTRAFGKSVPIITAVSALLGGASYMLQLISAKNLPATVLYPFITGGGIIFSAIMDLFVFKERITKKLAASVALCFFGIIFLL